MVSKAYRVGRVTSNNSAALDTFSPDSLKAMQIANRSAASRASRKLKIRRQLSPGANSKSFNSMNVPWAMTTARLILCSNSRTFPGQSYASSADMASSLNPKILRAICLA